MLKEYWDKYKLSYFAFLTGLFYIAWASFVGYKPFYFHDESVVSPFSIYEGLDSMKPLYLKIFMGLQEFLSDKEIVNGLILIVHFFNAMLFFGLFDKKNKIPWATIILIFSPFVFYNLSLQDYRQSFLETLGILYIYVNYFKEDFKFKNIILIVMLMLGILIDYTFILFICLDLFHGTRGRNLYFRILIATVFTSVLVYYDRFSLNSLTPKAELLYMKNSVSIGQYALLFVNAILEFFGGTQSFGIKFVEHKVILRDLFFKIIFLASSFVFVVKFYRKKMIPLLVLILVLFFYNYAIESSSMLLALAGSYCNTISVKAAIFAPAFLGGIYALSNRPEEKKPLVYFCLIIGLVSWINFSNNSSNNIFNVHRNDAPVFWGVLQNPELRFPRTFSQVYPDEVKSLSANEKVFVDGLKNIDRSAYLKYFSDRKKGESLLDVFVYLNQGRFIEAQETLGAISLTGFITKESFLKLASTINSNFERKLRDTIHPLIFELIREKETMSLAESLYVLSLLQYSNIGAVEAKRVLINEFGNVFKPEK